MGLFSVLKPHMNAPCASVGLGSTLFRHQVRMFLYSWVFVEMYYSSYSFPPSAFVFVLLLGFFSQFIL